MLFVLITVQWVLVVRGKTGVYYSLIWIGEEKGVVLGARHPHVVISPSCITLEFSSLSCEAGTEVRGSHFRGLYGIDLEKVYHVHHVH